MIVFTHVVAQFNTPQLWLHAYRRSLATRLTVILILVALLITCAQSIVGGAMTRQQLERQIGTELGVLANSTSIVLDRELSERLREIQTLVGLNDLSDPRVAPAAKRALLERVQQTYPLYSWIGLTDTRGQVLVSTDGLLEGGDVSARPWFLHARHGSYLGDVHEAKLLAQLLPNTTGEPLRFVDIAAPVYAPDGRFVGVLGAHLNWKWATELQRSLFGSVPHQRQIDIFIVRADGMVLLGPTLEGQHLDVAAPAASAAQAFMVRQWPDEKLYLTSHSQPQRDPTIPSLNWRVVLRQPIDIAYAPAQAIEARVIVWIAGLACLLIVLSALIVRRVTIPLRAIASSAERMSNGDRSLPLPLIAGHDEIARTSTAIHKLIASLQSQEAEARISARQAETLLRISRRFNGEVDLATMYSLVCEEAANAVGAASVILRLYNPDTDQLDLIHHIGLPAEYRIRVPALAQTTFHNNLGILERPLTPHDTIPPSAQPLFDVLQQFGMRPAAAVPLKQGTHLVGLLNVLVYADAPALSEHDLTLLQGIADQATLAITKAQSYDRACRRLEHVHALRRIDVAISARYDLTTTLHIGLAQVVLQLQADAAHVWLYDPGVCALRWQAGYDLHGATSVPTAATDTNNAAYAVWRSAKLIRLPNDAVPTLDEQYQQRYTLGYHAYYGTPLVINGLVIGVLEVLCRTPPAIAADSATLFEQLQQANRDLVGAYDTTLEGWSRALDLRDKETEGHTQRVTEWTLRLAQAVGMRDEALVHVRRGALLHDIGKMGVPDSILLKPGKLTPEEWSIMRRHPSYAYDLLAPIPFLNEALAIPHCHHERWDGSGYPRGLKGEEIPLAARVFAVIDVWDALRSERPYKPAWSAEQARAQLIADSGTFFDPHIVATFLSLLDEGLFTDERFLQHGSR
jgi:HD-GYP domain-containing protein (c-di-GMP phosphodiesterase class II)